MSETLNIMAPVALFALGGFLLVAFVRWLDSRADAGRVGGTEMMALPRNEFKGMTAEQASRLAGQLIKREGWYRAWDKLAELRFIIARDPYS